MHLSLAPPWQRDYMFMFRAPDRVGWPMAALLRGHRRPAIGVLLNE
jgi:hypothetical protein